jgi:sugar-specific transcriptional regulator TrmB
MDLLDSLVETGLTRHEARLFVLLSGEGALSGYEAAKLTGMSRSNAYLALAGLTDKGGAVCIDGAVKRFAAVPVDEYCSNKLRHLQSVLSVVKDQMPAAREVAEPFLTVKGREHILDKMRNLILQANYRVYLSLATEEVLCVQDALVNLRDRGRKIVLITSPPFSLPGITVYHAMKKPGQIRLIADSETVFTGEINDQGESSCLFSRHQALVTLFKEALINEIQLIMTSHQQDDIIKQKEHNQTTEDMANDS